MQVQVRGNKDGQKLGALGAGGEYKEYKQNFDWKRGNTKDYT